MKKFYKTRQATEMAIRSNLSQEVQEYISSTDPLDIRVRVSGIIEADGQEFESWEEVERHFLGVIEELKRLEELENVED